MAVYTPLHVTRDHHSQQATFLNPSPSRLALSVGCWNERELFSGIVTR